MKSVGCAPKTSADLDSGCFRTFLTRFGRRALRRPLTDPEITSFMRLFTFAQEDADFYAAVGGAVRLFLQHPETVYRVEADTGRAVPGQSGAFWLNGFEMAARLSFLLWGEGPDDALLD